MLPLSQLSATLLALSLSGAVRAIGQHTCVSFSRSSSAFSIASNGQAAPVFLSSDDWPGVQLAASNFVSDIHNVTGIKPRLSNFTSTSSDLKTSTPPVIVGTLGKSSLIAQVLNHTRLDVSAIEGKWEAFVSQVVKNPLPGVDTAYVIIGSDKRGTIFALYDHSEQFGVSPWYWWADVPVTKHPSLFVSPSGCSHGEPTVKYRGLFLNDEQPALTNWAMEKFTNGTGAPLTGSPFSHFFYTKLFDLLLRMKANYLWPAQWASAFNVDDPLNQFLADYYGIVMGTSHEEPMMRSIPVEWDLFGTGPWDYTTNNQTIHQFWINGTERAKPFESLYTIGMRGNGDLPISAGNAIQTLEDIVADQRGILQNVFNITDVTSIPQMWCLYQEVKGYYDEGLRVPDDVTLLWTDDNWGNLRRYPLPSERNRTGGAGVYYHYDLVGDPRDYKWITTTQISKVYEQMSLAVDRDATRIWILNVGDLKPYEMSIEFFLTLGYDASRWSTTNTTSFITSWATREFDLSAEDASEVASVVVNATRYLSRRKPEFLNSTTFSLTNYREADNMLAAWNSVNESASRIYGTLSSDKKAAFFQLVYHPVQAGYTVTNMWISAGINNMRAQQARLSTNNYATQVEELFEQDYDLEHEYHTILGGKWDHMMDQTHVMYYYWQQPMTNTMPPVSRVASRKQALAGAMRITPEGILGTWPGDNQYQCSLGYNCGNPSLTLDPFVPAGNRFVDVSAGGPSPFTFTATANASWVKITPAHGSISPSDPEQRVLLSVDWDQVEGSQTAVVVFKATAKGQPALSVPVTFTANHTAAPSGFKGFVEGDGVVSIEAGHASRNTSVGQVAWQEILDYGRTLSGVTPWPRWGNNEANYTAGSGPSIEYDFYTFNSIAQGGNVSVTAYVSPSLNAFENDRPLALGVQVDGGAPQTTYFIPASQPGVEPPGWEGADGFVANSIVSVTGTFAAPPGAHVLKLWMVEPAVVVQKIVIDTGGLLPSYLGPPESVRLT